MKKNKIGERGPGSKEAEKWGAAENTIFRSGPQHLKYFFFF